MTELEKHNFKNLHFDFDLTDDECIYLTRGDQEIFKQDAIAIAKHFKLTAEDL